MKDEKRVNADNKLKPLAKKAWDKSRDSMYSLKDILDRALGDQAVDESSGSDNSKANNDMNYKAHRAIPSSDYV